MSANTHGVGCRGARSGEREPPTTRDPIMTRPRTLLRLASAAGLACSATISTAGDGPAVLLAAGNQSSCAWSAASGLQCWGRWDHALPPAPPSGAVLTDLVLGDRHGCYAHGTQVTCWGLEASRPLPRSGSPHQEARTHELPGAIAELTAGAWHTCARTTDGRVFCWGINDFGQLGHDGDDTGTPQPVTADFTAAGLAAGLLHTCALDNGGKVHCWGNGSEGQRGNGEKTSGHVPVTVKDLDGVVQITANLYNTCARTGDGAVHCWGNNKFDQLGRGGSGTASPEKVDLSVAATALHGGGYFNCVSGGDGKHYCWGWDEQNQLGELTDGSKPGTHGFRMQTKPAATAVPLDRKSVAVGWGHGCAADGPRQIVCWGRNDAGQLGNGDTDSSAAPVAVTVAGLQGSTKVPARAEHLGQPGLDVSYHSGPVDWRQLRDADYAFAFVLTTAGVDFRDPMVDAHWSELKQAGFTRGAYHYYMAGDDPAEQARWFMRNAPLEPGDLAPVVDIEAAGANPPADLMANLKVFLQALQDHYGVTPIIYTGPTFWDQHGSPDFGHHPLWVANYQTDSPKLPRGWSEWTIWQWQGDSELPGVASADLNRMAEHASLARLRIPEPANRNDGGG